MDFLSSRPCVFFVKCGDVLDARQPKTDDPYGFAMVMFVGTRKNGEWERNDIQIYIYIYKVVPPFDS